MTLRPAIEAVTARVIERPRPLRAAYLDLIAKEQDSGISEARLDSADRGASAMLAPMEAAL